jgi:hypothetical protein
LFFFFGRIGVGMPMSWQVSAVSAVEECGPLSTSTVALPMNISLSCEGGFWNGPPNGT